MRITRTFRHYSIKFDGAEWCYYTTPEEAQKVLAGCSRPGEVVAHDFDVTFTSQHLLTLNNQRVRDGLVELVRETVWG